MRSIEALQSENPNFPKARTWNAYVVPGARLCTVVGGFVLGATIVVQWTAAPAAGTAA